MNIFRLPRTNLQKFYFIDTIRTLAFAFLALFIGILIIEHLDWLEPHIAITVAALGFAAALLARLATLPVVSVLAEKLGLKALFIIGLVLSGLAIFLFSQSYFISGLIVMTIGDNFYWYAYYFTVLDAKSANRNGGIGATLAFETLANVAAPLITAWLISMGSEDFFYIAIGCIVVALVITSRMSNHRTTGPLRFSDLVTVARKYKHDTIMIFGYSFEVIIRAVAWPIALYLLMGSIWTVALISTTAMLIAAVLDILLGQTLHKLRLNTVERGTSVLIAIIWFCRALFQTPLFWGLSEVAYNTIIGVRDLPILSVTFSHAEKEYPEAYITYRQSFHILGMLTGALAFAIIAYLQLPLIVAFILAGIASLLVSAIKA